MTRGGALMSYDVSSEEARAIPLLRGARHGALALRGSPPHMRPHDACAAAFSHICPHTP